MDESSIVLFANFDSANMARYERVYKVAAVNNNSTSQNPIHPNNSNINSNNQSSQNNENSIKNNNTPPITNSIQKYDVEFNVWTRQDCEDTQIGPNANRTWFYFGVKGGHGKWIKFNLMNLNKQGRLFEMGMLPVFRTIPGHENWSRIYTRPTWQNNENNFQMSFVHRLPDKKDSMTYFAFCFPYSYEESQNQLGKYDEQFSYCGNLASDLRSSNQQFDQSSIYYHRELLCYSLDKRRIDLITISACNNLTFRREPRFDPQNLFPDKNEKRCYKFEKKRVFLLTSRVHPGETPSSFVFNGFLEFILRKDDVRAKILRQNFVFKLVPMLNPDGVSRGYYRTDQLGVNLNRVYLDPSPKWHPSIYAIKSLIVYHHINNRTSKEHDGLNFESLFQLEYDKSDQLDDLDGENDYLNEDIGLMMNEKDLKMATDEPTRQSFKGLNHQISQINTRIKFNSSNEINNKSKKILQLNNINSNNFRNDSAANEKTAQIKSEIECDVFKGNIEIEQDLDFNDNENDNLENNDDSHRIGNENSDEDETSTNNLNIKRTLSSCGTGVGGIKNSPHLNDPKLSLINPLWSGIAFYVDLHGHAARRGCFIYGNSIDNELLQIENVLFAKLISFNSQHFDFDGCNFSVRNMYMKDKREGLSKEGSGRVAMHKTLGILHSYTLECCYASGRVMNTISPAINTTNGFINTLHGKFNSSLNNSSAAGRISPPLHTDIPPKFLPEHYADVGKAVAIAALDIVEMNPFTRIPNTSFGSLESVRNWIKFYIKSKNGGGINTSASNSNQNNNNTTSSSLSNNTINNFKDSNNNIMNGDSNKKLLLNNSNQQQRGTQSMNQQQQQQQQNQNSKLNRLLNSNNLNTSKSHENLRLKRNSTTNINFNNNNSKSNTNVLMMPKKSSMSMNNQQDVSLKKSNTYSAPINHNNATSTSPLSKPSSASELAFNSGNENGNGSAKTPQPPFTSFKTTDLFDQLSSSLKFRSSSKISTYNSKNYQKSKIEGLNDGDDVCLGSSLGVPTATTPTLGPKKSNYSSLKLFESTNITACSSEDIKFKLSKSQTENHQQKASKLFNSNKKLLPIKKAAVFSSSGNNNNDNNNKNNNISNSSSSSSLNNFINNTAAPGASISSSFTNNNRNNSNLTLLNKLNEQLIKNSSQNNNSKNNKKLIENLKTKTTNVLIDFALDSAVAAAVAVAASSSSNNLHHSNKINNTTASKTNATNTANTTTTLTRRLIQATPANLSFQTIYPNKSNSEK